MLGFSAFFYGYAYTLYTTRPVHCALLVVAAVSCYLARVSLVVVE